MANDLCKRQQLVTRWGSLKTERTSWIGQWAEISRYLLPYNGRFFLQDRDKGNRKFNQIYGQHRNAGAADAGCGVDGGSDESGAAVVSAANA